MDGQCNGRNHRAAVDAAVGPHAHGPGNRTGARARINALSHRSLVPQLDFNCDLGEGCGNDAAIVPLVSSASIACGGHAGDATSMGETVGLCLRHGVAVGAHPAYEDRANFGRRELDVGLHEIHASVTRQLAALQSVCQALGARMQHVKPHGALYNVAARDEAVANAIAAAVHAFDPSLILYGLSDSALTKAGSEIGLRVAHEVFAERAYDADGRLAPRGTPGAVLENIGDSVAQVRMLLRNGAVIARDGSRVPLRADTLCLHGDRPDAVAFARVLRDTLGEEGVQVRAPGAGA